MARQISFRQRRIVSLAATVAAIVLVWAIGWLQRARLADVSFFSGVTLLAAIILLVLLGVRRRLPVLPLGNVSTWTQIHLYTGLFAGAVYAMHVPSLIAGGQFESGLSVLFLTVTASGVYGIFASRRLPRRLTAIDGQHRFDRVGWHRSQIAATADGLLHRLQERSSVAVLGQYYGASLKPFFETRPPLVYLIAPIGARRRRLLSGLSELNRYLESEGKTASGQLAALVRHRDDLDYQYALQLRLRTWVVVHAVFSVVLLIAAIVHAVLAWRFAG